LPELILTSPYARAVETAQIAAEVLGLGERVVIEHSLTPGAQLRSLSSIAKAHPSVRCVLLVGHEPDLSSLVAALCGGGQVELDKAGLAQVRLDPAGRPPGVLVWLA
jgi:phosphohistidine phosphatase